MIRINYIINKRLIHYKEQDVHQDKHVRKHDRSLVESTSNIKSQHVSEVNMEHAVSAFSKVSTEFMTCFRTGFS